VLCARVAAPTPVGGALRERPRLVMRRDDRKNDHYERSSRKEQHYGGGAHDGPVPACPPLLLLQRNSRRVRWTIAGGRIVQLYPGDPTPRATEKNHDASCRQRTRPHSPSHHGEVTKDRGSWGADLARPSVKGAWFLSRDCPLFRPGISPVGANLASVMHCRRSLLPAAGRCGCCHRCCQSRAVSAARTFDSGPGPSAGRPLPIGLTAADPFAGGEVSRADSRVR